MNKTYEEVDVRHDSFHPDIRARKERGEKPHFEDGAACTRYCNDGSFRLRVWFRDGKIHRDDGPENVLYHQGQVFPGDARTFEELERDGAVVDARWGLNGIGQY